jgi:hypothetical protein
MKTIALVIVLTLPLGGCAYDYLQRSDRVAYSAGDAVKANLEQQTTDPSNANMYDTKGLGKNGAIAPPEPPVVE